MAELDDEPQGDAAPSDDGELDLDALMDELDDEPQEKPESDTTKTANAKEETETEEADDLDLDTLMA
jgi:hypothetical protein